MAAVELTFSGVLYDKYNRTQQNVVLIGEASLTGVGVGGGPIMPPGGGGGPPGIWGPTDPRPTPPIMWPGYPGGGGGGQPPGGGAPPHPSHPIYPGEHPEHPIELPPEVPPDIPAPPDLFTWKVAWTEETGWIVVAVPNTPHPVPSRKK